MTDAPNTWTRTTVHRTLNKAFEILHAGPHYVSPKATSIAYANSAMDWPNRFLTPQLVEGVERAIFFGKGLEGHDVDILSIEDDNPLDTIAYRLNMLRQIPPPPTYFDELSPREQRGEQSPRARWRQNGAHR